MVIDVAEDQFSALILKQSQPLILQFWAEWCGNSRKMIPIYAAVAEQLQERVLAYRLNIDHNPTVPRQYGIRGVPVFMIMHQGRILDTHTGVMEEGEFAAWIQRHLPAAG
ncbi:thioredoxin family protein [Magnetofaba australis]|uniref:Thioredoxin n=1 Tax=Magnetofaba australis IT-1 TaxID=1434232 RepID=A0A1Y2K1G6_9PROT|nr:thioredoxin family protein [Magnetofaba australis]OSM01822.1 putative thioredoxin domain-containing protein [Magnetofaba australis IT-1]